MGGGSFRHQGLAGQPVSDAGGDVVLKGFCFRSPGSRVLATHHVFAGDPGEKEKT
jgi:hypothetical protein